MHESYKKWLDDGSPEVICQCSCYEEIIIKESHKYDGIPRYINRHHNRKYRIHDSYKDWIKNGYPKVYCSCGCNGEIIVRQYHTTYGIPKWVKGHKPCLEETKQKISEGNKGKIVSKETKQKMCDSHPNQQGKNNNNYIDGRSFKPYCERFNEKLKEEIRKRDNRICQNCGKDEINNGIKLSIHHIHYDKENCYPNLISLCTSCNSKSNSNRKYWEEYFMKKLKERNLLNYFGDNYGNG